ncbi:MAG TPA: ATP-binding protein [Candidatus Paceibacterota bacterium]|nr:ATP-binding protein [Candidatus Paceibacterota bacterium]
MKTEAVTYIQEQINRGEARLVPYVFKSPTFTYPERHMVIKVMKYVRDFLKGERDYRWVVVPGLRGVGKTTVMAQVFLSTKRNTVPTAANFLYFSTDDLVTRGLSLTDALDAYEYVLNVPFEKLDRPTLLFIDEVQQDKNWAAVLKSLHDRARNIFIFTTGSSAVSLQSNPDVARRAKFEKLYPLSFGEYQMIKNNKFPSAGLKNQIKEALYEAASAEDAFNRLKKLESTVAAQWARFDRSDINEYLMNGTLPFTLKELTPSAYDNISILLDRIIDKDIKDLGQFDAATLSAAKRLLFMMAEGDVLSANKASNILKISYNTIQAVLDALEKAELIIKVPAQGSNAAQARKPAKYLFMSPAMRAALLNVTGIGETFMGRRGKFLEDVAGLHFYREFVATRTGTLTYDVSQGGADFILQIANKKQIAFEVGIGRKGYEQAKQTMKNYKTDFGVVVCTTDLMLSKEDNVVKLPLDYFLLM